MITSILSLIPTRIWQSGRSRKWLYWVVFAVTSALAGAGSVGAPAYADTTVTCAYDPASGQPNPLGNRAFITATETDGNTQFVYDVFPSRVEGGVAATIESRRTLIFYKTGMEDARALLRENLPFYYELIGYEDTAGFSSYDEAMSCN